MADKRLIGTQFGLTGIVEEHLTLGDNEWLTLRFEDNSKLTINRKYCEEVSSKGKEDDDSLD